MILQAGNVLKGNSAGWAQNLCCATSRGAGWLTVRIRSRIFRTLIRPCCLFVCLQAPHLLQALTSFFPAALIGY